jgi:hypothetical protein
MTSPKIAVTRPSLALAGLRPAKVAHGERLPMLLQTMVLLFSRMSFLGMARIFAF